MAETCRGSDLSRVILHESPASVGTTSGWMKKYILARHRGFAARLRPMDCNSCAWRHPVESQSRRPAAKVYRILAKTGVPLKETDRAFQLGPHSGFGTRISARGALLRCPVLRRGESIMMSALVSGNSENHSSTGSHKTGSVWSDGY